MTETSATRVEASDARPNSQRKTVIITIVLTSLALAGLVYGLLQLRPLREWADRKISLPAPLVTDPDQPNLRGVLLEDRNGAAASGDLVHAAQINGQLSQEALLRALDVHIEWLARRDPQTKLYSQHPGRREWNYRNTAADFFCFHLHAALRLNPAGMPSLLETFEAESKLRTSEGLCQPVIAATLEPVEVDHDELLFGTSEYAKDGLISVYELYGAELVGERLFAIVDAVIAGSRHESKFGKLPGMGAEINGNMLQLCGRLSYAGDRADYAEFAARIADAMTQQSLPANNGLPPKFFDYTENEIEESIIKLKDHGNEAVLGLAEAYAMAVDKRGAQPWGERAGRWAEPVGRMFELILEHGVNEQGLIAGTMNASPPWVETDQLCDNWGYILSGAILYTQAARRHGLIEAGRLDAIERRVEMIARASFARSPGQPWSGGMDSEADAIESALYVAAYWPPLRTEALRWADQQMDTLNRAQSRDEATGIPDYLEGNFIRTSLMYADARAAGWRAEPWRADVRVGFAEDASGKAALTIWCTEPYTGVLRPDPPRHRTIMKLPWNWARLNSWPEWYTVTDDSRVTRATGISAPKGVEQLRDGVRLNLPAHGSATLLLTRDDSAGR
jgi:hypothetical protein